MFFTKKNFLNAILLATLSTTYSCTKEDKLIPDVEEKNKTNFKFLTLNHASSHGDTPSLTHVSHDGVITPDIYFLSNNELMPDKVSNINLIGDKFYLTGCSLNQSWYLDGYIKVMDTSTFKITNSYDFKYNDTQIEINMVCSADLGNNKLLVAGTLSSDETIMNFGIISLEQKKILSSARLNFSVKKMIKVGNKIFMAGPVINLNKSKIGVLDISNPTPEGIRTVSEGSLFDGSTPTFLIDNKGIIWAAIHDNTGSYVISIDPQTEKITKKIKLPYSITSLSSVGIAIDKESKYIYIRSNRAFYKLDTSIEKEPEDVDFEITSEVVDGGMSCADLQITKDGNLLFIRSISDKGKSCEVFELNPNNWQVEKKYTTNINSRQIFVLN